MITLLFLLGWYLYTCIITKLFFKYVTDESSPNNEEIALFGAGFAITVIIPILFTIVLILSCIVYLAVRILNLIK